MIVALAASILVAAASPSPSPSPPPIGSVTVVTGSPQSLHDAPQATSVLDARALRASTAPSLDAALRDLAGVDLDRSNQPFTNYGQLRLSFSGAGEDRGALFVDGIPAQDGFGGQVDWNAYAYPSIVRAELLRGPGSALYGSGAIGGVLSLTTLPPSSTPSGTVLGSIGGIDRGSAAFLATEPIAPGWSSATTLWTTHLGYDVIPPTQRSPVDRTATSSADVAHVRIGYDGARSRLSLDALAGDDGQSDGRPNDGFTRNLGQAAATWSSGTISTVSVTGFVRSTYLDVLADQYPSKPGVELYEQHVASSDAGLRERWDAPAPDGTIAVVADQRFVTGHNDQVSYTGATTSNVAGTQKLDGLAFERVWDGRLGGVLGARYDTVATDAITQRSTGALSPRADVRYDLSPATAFRAAYGTGLRAPFLNELLRSFKVGAVTEESNPNLAPERSRSGQAGFDIVMPGAQHLAFDWTRTRVHDALSVVTIGTNLEQRANVGETATDAYTVDYSRGGPCGRVHAFGVLQHDRVVQGVAQDVGKRLPFVPDAAAAVDLERTDRAITETLELSYSGPTFSDDAQAVPLGTAFLIGGRLAWRAADGTLVTLAFNNLTDRIYLTSSDRIGPPATATLRVAFPVGPRPAAPPVCAGTSSA